MNRKNVDDEFIQKMNRQIEENKKLIADAKETIEKMRKFFRDLGADLDSGRNIFLESENLSPEGRREAEKIIAKIKQEYQQRRRELRRQNEEFRALRRVNGAEPATEEPVRPTAKRIKI